MATHLAQQAEKPSIVILPTQFPGEYKDQFLREVRKLVDSHTVPGALFNFQDILVPGALLPQPNGPPVQHANAADRDHAKAMREYEGQIYTTFEAKSEIIRAALRACISNHTTQIDINNRSILEIVEAINAFLLGQQDEATLAHEWTASQTIYEHENFIDFIQRMTDNPHFLLYPATRAKHAMDAVEHIPMFAQMNLDFKKLHPLSMNRTLGQYSTFIQEQIGIYNGSPTANFAVHLPKNRKAAAGGGPTAAAATATPRARKTLISQLCIPNPTFQSNPNPPIAANAGKRYCFSHGWVSSHQGSTCTALTVDPMRTPAILAATFPCHLRDAANTLYAGNQNVSTRF